VAKCSNDIAISVIGTLPPLKGISPYCADYALSIAETVRVEFINFRKLYPERLYPGGTSCEDLYPFDISHPNLEVRDLLTWYNPFSWIKAGIVMKGDVIHAQWWSYPLAPIFLTMLSIARLRRKKIVLTVHNVYPHEGGRLKRFLNASVLPLAHTLLVHSEKNKKELVELGWSPDRIEVIPHYALKRDRFSSIRTIESRDGAREKLGIPSENKVLCFFGNIREYKGLDDLLLALDKIREDLPEIRLIIAGQPWEEWGKYERIIREKRLEPYLITRPYFIPFQELSLYLRASDLAVFPFKELHSSSDSASLALAMGCNVMSTRHLELPEGDRIHIVEDSHYKILAEGITGYSSDQDKSRIQADG
jgi:glycosyltransferase involved in cell wall biosynthesis